MIDCGGGEAMDEDGEEAIETKTTNFFQFLLSILQINL